MKKTIIAICGDKGSGKSTLAKELYTRLDSCMIIPFAGMAKSCVETITGVNMLDRQPDGSYDYSPKQKSMVLPGGCTLGVFVRDFAEKVRELDPFVWIDATMRIIDESRHRNFIIPDMRLPFEWDALNKAGSGDDYNVYMCRLQPGSKLLEKTGMDDGRSSDHHTELSHRGMVVDDTFPNEYGMSNIQFIADTIISGLKSSSFLG